jgi:hypothetical protein
MFATEKYWMLTAREVKHVVCHLYARGSGFAMRLHAGKAQRKQETPANGHSNGCQTIHREGQRRH